ncbi:hypothetical protein JQ615_20265 [Bradyrhizobium jicamae]|uniref:Uncharacterized protein n=1 Tax=Bradyrhizobium jicamae TaxID=280332 RepID=A0ABS5FLR4_9BRAD|nr:hypothetical protein [Bradyrhizobium jicamae]MBR0797723.1 hypothetical protein [Bradyrhizobium jicamae]MBR0933263.1 hypothetical protein [Bradyrhizobium jicamae]
MFARKGIFSSVGRAATLATIAAVALAAVEPTMAFAGSAPGGKASPAKAAAVTTSHGISGATDISARRRYYPGGGAAAAAAFAGIVGTGLAIAAAQNRRADYDAYGYYDGGPAYYGGGPVYYGGPGYYGGGYGGYYGNRSGLAYQPY